VKRFLLFFIGIPAKIESDMAISLTLHNTTIHVGDTVSIHYKIIEKEVVSGKTKREKHEEQKERTQAFAGTVIAIRGKGNGQSFVVRHMGIGNIGVERIFPVISPWIKKVVVKRKGNVRRAKLYYLRQKSKKEIQKAAKESSIKPELASDQSTTAANVKQQSA
jgi:large subunit ribosomal protein L19